MRDMHTYNARVHDKTPLHFVKILPKTFLMHTLMRRARAQCTTTTKTTNKILRKAKKEVVVVVGRAAYIHRNCAVLIMEGV